MIAGKIYVREIIPLDNLDSHKNFAEMKRVLCFFVLGILCQLKGYSQSDLVLKIEEQLTAQALDEAELLVDEQLHLKDSQAVWFYYKGLIKSRQYQYLQAEAAYRKATQLDDVYKPYWHALANTYLKLGNANKGIAIYNEHLLNDTLVLSYGGELAAIYVKERMYKEACKLYDSLLTIDADNYYFYKQLGLCYSRLGQRIKGRKCYLRALELNKHDVDLYSRLGNSFIKDRAFKKAQIIVKRGLKISPKDVGLHKILAYSLYLDRAFTESIQGFSKVLSLGDTSGFTKKYLGLALFRDHQWDTSAVWLRDAAKTQPTDFEVQFYAGSALVRAEEPMWALYHLSMALGSLQPPNDLLAEVYSELGEAYVVYENYKQAARFFKKAYEKDSKAIYSFKLGNVYDRYLNNPKLAVSYYDGYLRLLPDEIAMQDTLSGQANVSLPQIARTRIKAINEELFFAGEQIE